MNIRRFLRSLSKITLKCGKLFIFYLIFYTCLSAFFGGSLLLFYRSLDTNRPTWTLDQSLISSNPDLSFRPHPFLNGEVSNSIRFSASQPEIFQPYANDLRSYLQPYNYALDHPCNAKSDFGYSTNKPCVLVKINKLFNWVPKPYTDIPLPEEMPQNLKDIYDPSKIYISCHGKKTEDQKAMGSVAYYPDQGIPISQFPYTNQPNYVSPHVWAHFPELSVGRKLAVECRAWASNIVNSVAAFNLHLE